MEADNTVEDSHINGTSELVGAGDIRRWQDGQGGAQVNGVFLAQDPWTQMGTGFLWLDGGSAAQLEDLALVLGVAGRPQLGPFQAGPALALSGREFAWLLSNEEIWQQAVVGPELAVHLGIARLARILVQRADVLPFAALCDWDWGQVLRMPVRLAQEDGVFVRHDEGPTGRYAGMLIPAWRVEAGAALYRAYLGQAADLPRLAGNEHALAAWLWVCTDWLGRRSLVDSPRVHEVSTRQPFQIRYRGEEELLADWRRSLTDTSPQGPLLGFVADHWLMMRMLALELRGSGWEGALFDTTGKADWQVGFELIPPTQDESGTWTLRALLVHRWFAWRAPLAKWWQQPERGRWRIGSGVLREPDRWFLPQLARAAEVCPAVARLLVQPAPAETAVGAGEVMELVNQHVPRLLEAGFAVFTPRWEHVDLQDVRIRVGVKRVSRRRLASRRSATADSWFDVDRLIEFDWSVAVGDEELSREQFEALVREQQPYVQSGGTWKRVPVEAILERIRDLTKGVRTGTSVWDLARSVLQADDTDVPVEVSFSAEAAPAQQFLRSLAEAKAPPPRPLPNGFRGVLRDYQKHGVFWLLQLRDLGIGGCLADDMGLGKTIQVLAFLLSLKEQRQARGPHLLVCPTSLLSNWRAEIQRFTPDLKLYIHHGAARHGLDQTGRTTLSKAVATVDVVLTTFATLVRDIEELAQVAWDAVVVDEAQNIKNVDTKQAAAVRKLKARQRIALTGTPVENRLIELWAIMDFVNPGYLGGQSWFRRHFSGPVTAQPQGPQVRRLKRLLTPVLLRRRKTDPSVQAELPEKWEVRDTAGLKSEQAALYQSIVDDLWQRLPRAGSEMSRRGRILAALTRLKQVCDHPCLVAGGRGDVDRSGKLSLLVDLVEEVVEQGEAGLVFTQFREMGEIICDVLAERFGWRPGYLHGGLRPGERGELVARFQAGWPAPPILVLSLKAGGVGLNLTRANHVFHFDRWWNPAVEDQATDRAFRIGQTRDVQVHKLVCSGTLEERIDELIAAKRQLSAAVVGESEGWITELADADLQALFRLDVESALEEDG
ncbi:DEAD/DEAH box helicase [Alicyclobacillus shizuokensis]|uniref:DEAD/DEAH box helicase n=1 Tax=Alicyclobacillus shizuokensis TaxID=392014 RepID=UPI000833A1FB|nr:DEAD/DEAH box helicase [Alicyclobacillus shizuokensis]